MKNWPARSNASWRRVRCREVFAKMAWNAPNSLPGKVPCKNTWTCITVCWTRTKSFEPSELHLESRFIVAHTAPQSARCLGPLLVSAAPRRRTSIGRDGGDVPTGRYLHDLPFTGSTFRVRQASQNIFLFPQSAPGRTSLLQNVDATLSNGPRATLPQGLRPRYQP